jgi:hypothetical protein
VAAMLPQMILTAAIALTLIYAIKMCFYKGL